MQSLRGGTAKLSNKIRDVIKQLIAVLSFLLNLTGFQNLLGFLPNSLFSKTKLSAAT